MGSERRGQPDWGQAVRRVGPAGGKHTPSNRGQKGGCLDVILGIAGAGSLIAYGISQVMPG